jgi:hypothetical protein
LLVLVIVAILAAVLLQFLSNGGPTEPVNTGETDWLNNYRADVTSVGWLIQAGPASADLRRSEQGLFRWQLSGCAKRCADQWRTVFDRRLYDEPG